MQAAAAKNERGDTSRAAGGFLKRKIVNSNVNNFNLLLITRNWLFITDICQPFYPSNPALWCTLQFIIVKPLCNTFPYNGTTTTCEALWMGVPVITLAGRAHAGRVGTSLLSAVGLPEHIASDSEDYIARAKALAADSGRLSELRAGMREHVRTSSLCGARTFTRNLETAYLDMWRQWCVGQV